MFRSPALCVTLLIGRALSMDPHAAPALSHGVGVVIGGGMIGAGGGAMGGAIGSGTPLASHIARLSASLISGREPSYLDSGFDGSTLLYVTFCQWLYSALLVTPY